MFRTAPCLVAFSLLTLGWALPSKADTVVVKPQPGQRVIIKSPPSKVVIVRQAPVSQPQVVRDAPKKERGRKVGLHFNFGGTFGPDVRMGGFAGALRIRPTPYFAVDLGSGIYGGVDYNGNDRIEVPITADMRFFVNPKSKVQFYFLLGGGGSWARSERFTGERREFWYAGGQGGAGLEFRLTPGFAINGDVRGFVRSRVDNDPRPEFVSASGRTTNVSGGALFTAGATFYF